MKAVTQAEITAVRDAEGIGLEQAHRKLLRARAIEAIEEAKTLDELKESHARRRPRSPLISQTI